jgi:hypothetical protein
MKLVSKTHGRFWQMKGYLCSVAIALLASALLCTTALAGTPEQSGFSAIQGVQAQALSVDEMQQISGELNAYDIAAALAAQAATLSKYPKLQADTQKLADWTKANAVPINAAFQKLGVLTPCQTCTK